MRHDLRSHTLESKSKPRSMCDSRVKAAICVLIFTLIASSANAQLSLSLSNTAARVGDLLPGSTVAWLAVGHEGLPYLTAIRAREGLITDSDRDGIITIDFAGIPLRFALAVVDLDTGAWQIGTREGFLSSTIQPADRHGRARGLRATLDSIEIERNELELLLVRPRVDAWRFSALEGSPSDSDKASDAVLTIDFLSMSSLGSAREPAPGTLTPGDVLIAFDPEELSHLVVHVGRGNQGSPE